jgi:hypothetical protein
LDLTQPPSCDSITVMWRFMTRLRCLILILLLPILASCDEPVRLQAKVEPAQGHVPYDARVVCTPLAGTYHYELPDGVTIESTSNTLDVTVDKLDWQATVNWANDRQTATAVASAHGTNALPRILPPRISGDPYRWHLVPRERTLIDFTHYPAGLSGPGSGVVYEGTWHVVSVQVECKLKSLCGAPIGDSIFCPPYVDGKYHALWRGRVVENACIVYPLYTSETTQDGRPYPPAPEPGYTYDAPRVHDLFELMVQQNAILDRDSFPVQTAVIRVVIEDEWSRQTSASFDISVRPLLYETAYVPWISRTRFCFADRASPVYHLVRSEASSPYLLLTCSEACGIDLGDCLFFCRESDATESGRQLCPQCAGLR